MALSPTLSDPCDGSLEILDRDGHPIVIPDDAVPFFTSGIVHQSPGVLAYQSPDYVLSRRQVEALSARTSSTSPQTSDGPFTLETRWMTPSYDEVREVDRAMARRDRPRATAREVADRIEAASKITSKTES